MFIIIKHISFTKILRIVAGAQRHGADSDAAQVLSPKQATKHSLLVLTVKKKIVRVVLETTLYKHTNVTSL